MQFSILGPLEVTDGPASLPLGGPRQRSVLALLLLDPGGMVHPDRMVTEIWGDQPPHGARDSLYTYVSNLRGILGRDRIVRSDGGYRLERSNDDVVIADEFDTRLAEAHRIAGSDPEAALALIDQSLAWWRGRPYEGLEDLPSISPEVARLEELRLRAIEDRIEAELDVGGTPEVGGVEMLIAEHPYRERLWELLARVLYRAGRQTEALRSLNRLRRMLAEDLGIEASPSVSRLEERILLQDPSLEVGSTPTTNLPAPVSSFVGRAEELDRLERLMSEHRLVTVIGPGGAGKTRLAIEAARRVTGRYPDGIWFVDLAPVGAGDGVGRAVASTLGVAGSPDVDPTATVAAHLRTQTALVLIDNCEQVVDAVGELATRLLEAAPDVRIVATSRRPVDVTGEVQVPITGLGTSSEDVEPGDAEALFAIRAGAVQPGFALGKSNRTDVSSICRHLDGLPLAIELAAARVDTLSPSEIAHHLDDRFRFLADDRADRTSHRSLQASIDWSRNLLEPDDQLAFDALGVFEGPFTGSAVSAVCDSPAGIGTVEVLRRLVTTSLVQALPGDVTRYRLLETTRLYAGTHLHESGRWQATVDRHDEHYGDRCRELRGAFFGSGRPEACRSIEAEMADYEAAFDRFLVHDRDAALEMAWALGHVWLFSGRLGAGIGSLERLVAASAGSASPARADALAAGSFLLMFATRYEQAIGWADEAINIYRAIGDEQGVAYALARRGHLAFSVGDVPTALALLSESLETCEHIGYREGTAWPLTLLGQARLWGGDESDEVRHMLEEGRRRFITVGDTFGQLHANMFIPNVGDPGIDVKLRYAEESIDLSNRAGADPLMRPTALHNLAFSVWEAGERERAIGANRLSARAAIETGSTVASGMALLQAGLFAGLSGHPERAAILHGAGDAHFVMVRAPFYDRQLQPGIDASISALGEERYRQLVDDGAAMTIEDATDFLLRTI